MATLLFSARTVAVTLSNEEQLSLAHTLNTRWLPMAGGPAGAAGERAACRGGAICGLSMRQCASSPNRRKRWNCSAGGRSSSEANDAEYVGPTGAGLIVSPVKRYVEVFPG